MDNLGIRQYVSYKDGMLPAKKVAAFCAENGLAGTEVFMDDIVPRQLPLFPANRKRQALARKLAALRVKRLHGSYWGYPTSLLTKNRYGELVNRFGGEEAVAAYYGDVSGAHLFARWTQEYELACLLGAQAYTFHLIDYAPIDGEWIFTISRADIRQAMVFMAQQLLCRLGEAKLLSPESPRIELENAGWGLEYGFQTAEDYRELFRQVHDPLGKLKVAWDINHLLHALGRRGEAAGFMLPPEETVPSMRALERDCGGDPARLALRWLEANLLGDEKAGRIGAIHLSDCALKDTEYFTRGRLNPPYDREMAALRTWEEKESYGVRIVLEHYDSHVPLGRGVLSGRAVAALLRRTAAANPDMVLLHELKNSENLPADLQEQRANLAG